MEDITVNLGLRHEIYLLDDLLSVIIIVICLGNVFSKATISGSTDRVRIVLLNVYVTKDDVVRVPQGIVREERVDANLDFVGKSSGLQLDDYVMVLSNMVSKRII